jgi:hypothetical protein
MQIANCSRAILPATLLMLAVFNHCAYGANEAGAAPAPAAPVSQTPVATVIPRPQIVRPAPVNSVVKIIKTPKSATVPGGANATMSASAPVAATK